MKALFVPVVYVNPTNTKGVPSRARRSLVVGHLNKDQIHLIGLIYMDLFLNARQGLWTREQLFEGLQKARRAALKVHREGSELATTLHNSVLKYY